MVRLQKTDLELAPLDYVQGLWESGYLLSRTVLKDRQELQRGRFFTYIEPEVPIEETLKFGRGVTINDGLKVSPNETLAMLIQAYMARGGNRICVLEGMYTTKSDPLFQGVETLQISDYHRAEMEKQSRLLLQYVRFNGEDVYYVIDSPDRCTDLLEIWDLASSAAGPHLFMGVFAQLPNEIDIGIPGSEISKKSLLEIAKYTEHCVVDVYEDGGYLFWSRRDDVVFPKELLILN